jgi:hypothetical protein
MFEGEQYQELFQSVWTSTVLRDPEWLRDFRDSIRRFTTIAQEISRYHHLPGYPLSFKVVFLRIRGRQIREHLMRVFDDPTPVSQRPDAWPGPTFIDVFKWACDLVDESNPIFQPFNHQDGQADDELHAMLEEDSSWLPTESELAAWQAIFEDLSDSQIVASRVEPQSEMANLSRFDRESDRLIEKTLRTVGHRLTTTELIAEMDKLGLNPSESTVKKRLAAMVKEKRLDNEPKARPRGYGLPEWDGSFGSGGS